MKIHSAITFLFLLLTLTATSQTYVDIPWREGSIFKKGEEQKGMIRLGGGLGSPWLNNFKTYFVPNDKWVEGKKPRNKVIKEYRADDIDGYSTYTEDKDGNRFDMNFTSFEIMIMGAIRKKKGKAFLKLVESGGVDVFSYVPKPAKKILTSREELNKDKLRALSQGTLYLKKGDGELISAAESELVALLKECPSVVDKIQKEEYGFKPKSKRTKRKGMGKLLANAAGDNRLENSIYNAVKDYNNCIE